MVELSQAREELSQAQLSSAVNQVVSNACMYGKSGRLLSKATQRTYAADIRHMQLYFGLRGLDFNSISTDDFIDYSKIMKYEPRSVGKKLVVLGKVRRLLQESGASLADLSRAKVFNSIGKILKPDTSCVSARDFDDLIASMDFRKSDSDDFYLNLRDALAMTLVFHGGIRLENIIQADEESLVADSDGDGEIHVSYLNVPQGIGFRLPHEQYKWILEYFPELHAFKKSKCSDDKHLLVNHSGTGFHQTRSLRKNFSQLRLCSGLLNINQRKLARSFCYREVCNNR